MKVYSAYKESGFEFLGEIPSHWETKKLKYLSLVNFSNVDKHTIEGEEPVRLCNYVDVYYNDFITPEIEFMKATALPREIEKFSLKKGDTLLTKDSESWEDIAVPALVVDEMDGVLCGYHLAQIRPHSIDARFLFWAFGASDINDQYKVAANGITRYGLGKFSLENSSFPLPPLLEQKAIADFLDRKTAQIDTLIEKKQRQIELLEEQRTALINQAVTKGLWGVHGDATHLEGASHLAPRMKDSGIEWLGEIPSHWGVKRLKYLADIKTGERNTEDNVEDGKYPFFVRSQTVEKINSYSFDGEAVLTAGDGVGVAKVFHYINGKFDYHQRVYKFSNFQEVSGRYFFYFVRNFLADEVLKLSAKSTVDSLRLPMLQNFPVPTPYANTQEAIVRYLDQKEVVFKSTVSSVRKQIELLQEYRTALISASVTGKIDVREEGQGGSHL